MPQRHILNHTALANAGKVIQHHRLLCTRIAICDPTIIYVQHGQKILRWQGKETLIPAGKMVLLVGGQTFDVLNEPCPQVGYYAAHWLAIEQTVINQFTEQFGLVHSVKDVQILTPHYHLALCFDRLQQAISLPDLPSVILQLKLFELLAWLKNEQIGFAPYKKQHVVYQIRKLIAAHANFDWKAQHIAEHLGLSETSLRRALAQEHTSFRQLLGDVRMSRALTLLQITEWSISHIAYEVGYDSPSRFTVRFKERFGFLPSDVRERFSQRIQNEHQKLINVGLQSPL